MKTCSRCNKDYTATTENFNIQKDVPDGLNSWCKPCCNEYNRVRKNHRRNHTYEGFVARVWNNITKRCREESSYKGMLLIERKDFLRWALETLPTFCEDNNITLETGLVGRGISIDRIQDNLGYSIGNLQWLFITDNNKKQENEVTVQQYSKEGKLLNTFSSIREASYYIAKQEGREDNWKTTATGITRLLNDTTGKRKYVKGFSWKRVTKKN